VYKLKESFREDNMINNSIADITSSTTTTSSTMKERSSAGAKNRQEVKQIRSFKSKYNVVQRLALSHLQVIGLVGKFNLAWPPFIEETFSAVDTVSSLSFTDGLNSTLDCWLRGPYNIAIPMFSILTSSASLILIFLIPTLIWFVILPIFKCFGKICTRKKNNRHEQEERYQMKNSSKFVICIIALLYVSYSSMARSGLGIYNCTTFPGERSSRLVNALDYLCFEGEHLRWVLYVGIPFNAIVLIGIPLSGWFVLYRKRKVLVDDYNVVEKYGFLFSGYKLKYWYWEIIILIRKLLLASMTVFMTSTTSTYTQGLAALMIMFASLAIHLFFIPYEDSMLNNLETIGLACSIFTIYFGLLTFEWGGGTAGDKSQESTVAWVSTALIFVMNAVWFTFVLMILFDKYSNKLQKIVKKTRKRGNTEENSKRKFTPSDDEKNEHITHNPLMMLNK